MSVVNLFRTQCISVVGVNACYADLILKLYLSLQVCFDDFEVLFAQEREEMKKKRKLNPKTGMPSQVTLTSTASDTSPTHHLESPNFSQSLEYSLAPEQLSSTQEIPVSPTTTTLFRPSLKGGENESTLPETSNVILHHHKYSCRTTLPDKFDNMSPVCAEKWRTPSNELPGIL